MLSGLRYWLSPARRRFMRRLGRPVLTRLEERLSLVGSPAAIAFLSPLLRGNAEFLSFALSTDGVLARFGETATVTQAEGCLAAMLIFSVALFAREEIQREDSQLIGLLADVAAVAPKQVMLRRDQLRKAPRSEEWMLYTWMVNALGGARPEYDAELERAFAYQYLSYIGQYRPALERALGQLQS